MKRLGPTQARYYCEFVWGVTNFSRLAKQRARGVFSGFREPGAVQRETLEAKRLWLRRTLRKYPNWVLGHSRLGVVELELEKNGNEPLAPRNRATIRACAAAVAELSASGIRSPRAIAEGEYLEASLQFLDRDFATAYSGFTSLVAAEKFVQLDEQVSFRVLENAAACALLIDGKEAAETYYARLPARSRLPNAG